MRIAPTKSAALAGLALAASLAAGCASTGGKAKVPSASFTATHSFTVTPPAGAKEVKAWFAVPQNDEAQDVSNFAIACPHPWEVVGDDQGNWFLYVHAKGPKIEPFDVVETFDITRREVHTGPDAAKTRPLTEEETKTMAERGYLASNTHIPVNDEFRKIALDATGGDRNPVSAARKLYDWTLKNVDYWVKHPDRLKASPVGSAEYCLANKTGNCTDFHSLWTALARSAGIPTRMVYGSFFKKENDGKDADQSYHCWIEFWAPDLGWIAHDVAVADLFVGDFELNAENDSKVQLTTAAGYHGKDPAMVDWYFGNLDARRVVWHRGRDLHPKPGTAAPSVNALPKAYVEADGKALSEKEGWTRKLTFTEVK